MHGARRYHSIEKVYQLGDAEQRRAGFEPSGDERRLAQQKLPVLTAQITQPAEITGLVASYGAFVRHGSRSDSAKHTML